MSARCSTGTAIALRIARDLRATDVHPPLYFWAAAAWRELTGPACSGCACSPCCWRWRRWLVVGGIARRAGVPPLPAMLLTLGCYGFSYTAAVARGFALADLLTLAGVWLLLDAERRRRAVPALAGGLLLGLASFANYLAVFVGVAALLWLLVRRLRQPSLWLAAGLGFAAVMPADLFFFLAQRDSRVGQFPPFHLLPSLERLAQYAAGNVFGGLPLYAAGAARVALGIALALLLAGLVALIAWRWRTRAAGRARAAGRCRAGAAGRAAAARLRVRQHADRAALPRLCRAVLRVVAGRRAGDAAAGAGCCAAGAGAGGAGGLAGRPRAHAADHAAAGARRRGRRRRWPGRTAWCWCRAAMTASAWSARWCSPRPDRLRLRVVPRDEAPAAIRAGAGDAPVVVLALLGLDADSRAALPHMAAAFRDQPCWRETAQRADTVAFARDPACAPRAAR